MYNSSTVPKPTSKDYATHPKEAYVKRATNKTLQRGTNAIIYGDASIPVPTSRDYKTHSKDAHVKRASNRTLKRGTNAITYHHTAKE